MTIRERYNVHFASEDEARLAWALYCVARWGTEAEPRPFPGDLPSAPSRLVSRRVRDLFASLHQVDLSSYAARFTDLRPAGLGRWRGLCPLHEEDTPSFYIYEAPSWHFHCYGCQAHGDIVSLARELKLRGRLQ